MATDSSSAPARHATGALQQLGAVLATDLPRLLRERRTLWLAGIQVAAILGAVLLELYASAGVDTYELLVNWTFFLFLIPLVALFYGGPLLVEEIEQETLTFLTIRPVPKWVLYSGKWLAGVTVAAALTVAGFIGLWTVTSLVGSSSAPDPSIVLRTGLASVLAAAGYTSIFAALGVLFGRSVIGGVVYFILFDFVMGQIPIFKLLTVRFHVYNIGNLEKDSSAPLLGQLLSAGDITFDTIPWTVSVAASLVGTAVVVAIGAMIFSGRQYQL